MKKTSIRFALILLLSLTAQKIIMAQNTTLIPLKDFFRNPEKASFRISPDGKKLAFMQPWKSRMNVFVQEIGKDAVVQTTFAEERDIAGFAWKNNNRLIYLQDKGGNENFHLFAVDADGKNPKELTPGDAVRADIIDDLPENETEMIVGLNMRNPEIFDAYRINIITGEMKLVGENPGNITGWQTDNQGRIRVAVSTDGINSSVLYRNN
ncbi:MAG: TolB family protein, partial [Bacteroidia bacterium]